MRSMRVRASFSIECLHAVAGVSESLSACVFVSMRVNMLVSVYMYICAHVARFSNRRNVCLLCALARMCSVCGSSSRTTGPPALQSHHIYPHICSDLRVAPHRTTVFSVHALVCMRCAR